jgi:hypothetical protein
MRKILLATTALIAVGGVTAASADVSISGSAQVQYDSADGGESASTDGNITIKGSFVTDSGLNVMAVSNNAIQNGSSAAGASGIIEDAYIQVSGDFGTFRAGQTDMVNDQNDGLLGINSDVYTLGSVSHGTLIGTDTNDNDDDTSFGYISPSVNGMKFYAGAVPNGGSQLGVNFAVGGISLMAQTASGFKAGLDETSVGAGFSIAGFSVNLGKKQEDASGTKTDSMDMTLKYSLTDAATVSFLVEEGKQGTTKHENQALEIAYSIAPGLDAYVGYTSVDTAGVSASGTGVALSVSF